MMTLKELWDRLTNVVQKVLSKETLVRVLGDIVKAILLALATSLTKKWVCRQPAG
jgi:hypothetical protein